MKMSEIWIPEFFALLFLLLPLLRPLFKRLWPLEGLAWLPLLSLAISLGVYPAYGFRPETLPRVIFEILLTILNIPAMASSAAGRPTDTFRDRGIVFTAAALALWAAAGALALAFSPKIPVDLSVEGVRTVTIRDEGRDRDYFMRIYDSPGGPRPLPRILMIPPEFYSAAAVDRVCAALQNRGFTVISYSRRGFDFPAFGDRGRKHWASPRKIGEFWSVFRRGWKYQKENDRGRALEEGRGEDIAFLLPYIQQNRAFGQGPLVLAGYGAGAAALVYRAESPDLGGPDSGPAPVRGIVAVEAGLWRIYEAEPQPPAGPPAGAPWYASAWTAVRGWFTRFKPRQVRASGPAPSPAVPVLYLVSGRAADQGLRETRYRGVYKTLEAAAGPAALVWLADAGPLDYTNHPLSNPIYSALFPAGKKRELQGQALIDAAAAIIGNFSALAAADTPPDAPAGTPIPGIHIETRAWNLPDLRYILTW
jgi:hypothetical protein